MRFRPCTLELSCMAQFPSSLWFIVADRDGTPRWREVRVLCNLGGYRHRQLGLSWGDEDE